MTFPYARIRHLLVDLDGVLYLGETALPRAAAFVAWLHERDISVRLVTNNSTLTPTQYIEKLARMGIPVAAEEIFTSALATALYLKEEKAAGQTVYFLGEAGLAQALESAGLQHADHDPNWVIVGLDRTVTYEKLSTAALALESGARFVATNGDTSLPTERGLLPGAGAIIAALVATTGVQPTVIGKPQPLMLELAMKQMGGTLEDTAMLGDRLDTDIRAANALGIPSILVLTGVSKRSDLTGSAAQPSLVVGDLAGLMTAFEKG